ncbi:hypothetical protein GCM10025777_01230 [Membranihabitans marinus]
MVTVNLGIKIVDINQNANNKIRALPEVRDLADMPIAMKTNVDRYNTYAINKINIWGINGLKSCIRNMPIVTRKTGTIMMANCRNILSNLP